MQSSCPACGSGLTGDGPRRTCPRCGRPFALTISQPVAVDVYRAAPIVEIEPVRDRRPGFGVLVMEDGPGLELRIGDARMMTRARATAIVSMGIAGLWAVVEKLSAGWTWAAAFSASLVICLFVFTIYLVSRAVDPALDHDALAVSGENLVWKIIRRKVCVEERTAPLADLIGAHDEGDAIRLDFGGGNVWRVARGLGVPARARRWVAERVALLTPERGEG